MKHVRGLICLFIILTFIAATQGEPAATSRGISIVSPKGKELYLYKDYHALVVGVGEYDYWPDLRGAARDAREVAGTLKKFGMSVTLLTDPTSSELKEALNNLTYGVGREKNRAILFFFSGHGETETLATGEKLGYIIPKDSPVPSKDRIGFINKAISMTQIETYALRIQSKHVLMVFDSCFSGSVFSSLKGIPTDITEKSNRPVRQFITAGNESEQVPDESVFKICFLQGIKGEADGNSDGYVTGSELGMYLDSSVVNYSRGCQHPQYGKIRHPKLDKGDFIIKLASSGAAVEEPAASTSKTTLSVTSNVTGATVFVDNKNMGRIPVADLELSPGDHTIRVEKDGYDTYQKRIRLKEGRSLTITAYLDTIQPQTGSLYVDTDPDAAGVRILNITTKYYRGINLAPGRYHVEVSATGYETKKEWIDLSVGEDKYIDIRLTKRMETVPAQVQATGKTFTNTIGMKFVHIPPGTFMMGSPSNEPGREEDEQQHKVTLTKGFYVGVTEVTQKQWRTIMGSNPSQFKGDKRPVENVSWNKAKEFIRKLNQEEGTDKYRLPIEAEWEYACRAGTTTPFFTGRCISTDQANYDGGNPMPGCFKGIFRRETVDVASFSPNPWGLYDMHGNVWEWCEDWYNKNYPSHDVIDPQGSSAGSFYRVNRGGSWGHYGKYTRSANRGRRRPDYRFGYYGFRLVRDL